jgi:hypothetical protein
MREANDDAGGRAATSSVSPVNSQFAWRSVRKARAEFVGYRADETGKRPENAGAWLESSCAKFDGKNGRNYDGPMAPGFWVAQGQAARIRSG